MNDSRRGRDLPDFPEWDPEWDFLEPEEIEKRLIKGREGAEAFRQFLKAVDDLADGDDPESAMPESSRDILGPVFDAAMKTLGDENDRFVSGNIILNFKQYKALHDAYALAKNLELRELVSNVSVKFKKSNVFPSEVSFETERLELAGADKGVFARNLLYAASFHLTRTTRGTVIVGMTFGDMWVAIEDVAQKLNPPNSL